MSQKLNNTSKYPTSLLVSGGDALGIEIAKSLLEQGGYVIIIDNISQRAQEIYSQLGSYELLTLLDYDSIATLDDDLRRLDYVFYFKHQSSDLFESLSSQDFLQASNYLDAVLDLTTKFEAKFLLTTSIKAHQFAIGSEETKKANKYSDIEIQRYSEGLVEEYRDQVGIDARIVRLGELLGKGMDIAANTKLVKMMYQAINGEHLTLPGDGLESDYYVHYLDAAYGILKAQFSMNTRAKTFSLANDEEVTLLSIAYKLLELEPDAKEIIFNQNDNKLPPIKIYHPAPNLNTIGWKPRVSLERALVQSLDYMRLEQEKETKVPDAPSGDNQPEARTEKKGFLEIIRGFFFVQTKQSKNESEEDQSIDGALQRLVQERKMQERMRKGSIVLANSKIRQRLKPQKQLTTLERFAKQLNKSFSSLKKHFYFLRNITLGDFALIIGGLIAFSILYFLIVSPILSLGRNIYFISTNSDGLVNALQAYDIDSATERAENINTNVAEAQLRLADLNFLFGLLQQRDEYLQYQTLLADGKEYSAGLIDTLRALQPFSQLVKEFEPNVVYRISEGNLLAASPAPIMATLIEDINNNSAAIRIGVARMEKSKERLIAGIENSPDFLKQIIKPSIININGYYQNFSSLATSYEFMPKLLGRNSQKAYLLVIQDNARYTAGGGEIVGFIYFQVKDGSLVGISAIPISSNLNADLPLSSKAISSINLLSNKDVNSENALLSDVALIGNTDLRLQALKEIFMANENKPVDIIASVNLNLLEEFLRYRGAVEYQQVNFSDDNLLSGINLLMGSTQTKSNRDNIILNLYSKTIAREFNNLSDDFLNTVQIVAQARESGDLHLSSEEIDLKNYLIATSTSPSHASDRISFGLNYDQEKILINKYPIINISVIVDVNKDLSTSKQIIVSAAGTEGLQNIYVCNPNGSKNFTYPGVDPLLVTNTFSSDIFCTIFLEDDDIRYEMFFDTLTFENSSSTGYNYNLELVKNPGISANYDIEFRFNPELEVNPQSEDYLEQGGSFIYSGVLKGDLRFRFDIKQ